MKRKQKGFTLIELLMIISIIGVLAAVILLNTKPARIKALDTKKVDDLEAISRALELYYSDHGDYPAIPGGFPSLVSINTTWETALGDSLSPYISSIPTAPEGKYSGYIYIYYVGNSATQVCVTQGNGVATYILPNSDRQSYILRTSLQDPTSSLSSPGYSGIFVVGGGNYHVGTACP